MTLIRCATCGLQAHFTDKPPKGYVLCLCPKGDTETQEEIIKRARLWWLGLRPVGWKKTKHLKHPAVNATNQLERGLALAVAKMEESKP